MRVRLQSVTVGANSYSYFSFTTGGVAANITIRVSNPSLRIYAVNNYNSQDPTTLPSSTNSMWTSFVDRQSQNVLNIDATSNDPAHPVYTLAVYGTASSTFSILATTSTARIVRCSCGVVLLSYATRFLWSPNVACML